jgi:hypothetical protein
VIEVGRPAEGSWRRLLAAPPRPEANVFLTECLEGAGA